MITQVQRIIPMILLLSVFAAGIYVIVLSYNKKYTKGESIGILIAGLIMTFVGPPAVAFGADWIWTLMDRSANKLAATKAPLTVPTTSKIK